MNLTGRIAQPLIAVAMVLAWPAMAAAAPPPEDVPAGALTLAPPFQSASGNNSAAWHGDDEALTPTDSSERTCGPGGLSTDGQIMGRTVWYKAAGNGRWFTVNTRNTTAFDTILGVWDGGTLVGCNDDLDPDEEDLDSEARVHSAVGHTYYFQLGERCELADCTDTLGGAYRITLYGSPPYDDRAGAATLAQGNVNSYTNLGSTEAAGEKLVCSSAGKTSSFAKTSWLRYHAPTNGVATFTAASSGVPPLDTVLAVYRGTATNYSACNDDPGTAAGAAKVTIEVTAGDYFIQVGGYNPSPAYATAAAQGNFVPSVAFTPGLDHDGDKYQAPPQGGDCNDSNAAIHPGAAEVANNPVDENCDGVAAQDHDGDGYLAPPGGNDCDDNNAARHPNAAEVPGDGVDEDCSGAEDNDADNDGFNRPPFGQDCNDGNHSIHPGAGEIAGNFVDENCDGKKKVGALDPDPQFSMPNLAFSFGARITSPLVVSDVAKGYHVAVRCKGGGCPFKVQRKVAKNRKPLRFRRLVHHLLRPGSVVAVYVSRPHRNVRGRYARWTVHAGRQTVRKTACLQPPKFKRVVRCG